MLTNLSIRNYAIINELDVDFTSGFCVITGETGAGKSIILGALSLILGLRADISVLNNKNEKCVVEGRMLVPSKLNLKPFFEENDLDYDDLVILRREIAASGKSRAFINDTPVQLPVMRELGIMLIDIHSQHSNLELGKRQFQLHVIDLYGGHDEILKNYSDRYRELKNIETRFFELTEKAEQAKADLDYFEFQFRQLDEARLTDGEQELFEQEQEILTHAEEIKSGLSQTVQLLEGDEMNALNNMKQALSVLQKLRSFLPVVNELAERLESQLVEMRDIVDECTLLEERTEYDPGRLDEITSRLDLLYSLQQKHRVDSVAGLIATRDDFDRKLQTAALYDEELDEAGIQLKEQREVLLKLAQELRATRASLIPGIEKDVTAYLKLLGMPNGRFTVDLHERQELSPTGIDEVYFLFSANKGVVPEEINKIASGGEMSRLMLAIKTVVAKSKALPSIIFDEIDSGVSGETASKMAEILSAMSKNMQVINITHLPQIAAKGDTHYFVYKTDNASGVETGMKLLSKDERVIEVAKMLSGDNPPAEAIANAKLLMNS